MVGPAFPLRLGLLGLILLLLFSSAPSACEHQGGVVIVEATDAPRSEKEALLILPGFGSESEGVKGIRDRFSHQGYDLFIPDYISRKSLAECLTTLDRFMEKQHLAEYRKQHVFSYLVGAWTLNAWLREHPDNNIATIVYDRSPLQERAAYAAVYDIPFLTRLARGKIVEEFSKTPYEPIPNDGKGIGIIIESRATKLIRKHKETALSLGPVGWEVADLGQECDDHYYTLNNHDEMYHDLQEVGEEVLHFIRTGAFLPAAPRTKPEVDPFAKERPAASAGGQETP
jgi:hypothetical protein